MTDYFAVTAAMIRWGGSFVRTLGELYRLGDPDNQRRLLAAFPEYFERYETIAAQRQSELNL